MRQRKLPFFLPRTCGAPYWEAMMCDLVLFYGSGGLPSGHVTQASLTSRYRSVA